jgi:nucleoside-diphosphate-sugar epimerase
MKVLVTGGAGSVGRAAVARLVRNGHRVRVIGRRSGVTLDGAALRGAEYRSCDTTDYPSLREQVRGMEGIVHLAALPSPLSGPAPEVFRVNCAGTYNVYQAAAEEGIARISCASSINALGYNYGLHSFPLRYFPVDEAHPTCTTDVYSFSKQVTEEIAAYFWRREGISSVNLRLPAVYEATPEHMARIQEYARRFREAFQQLLALPEGQRRARVQAMIARFDATRPERSQPASGEELRQRRQGNMDDPDWVLIYGAFRRSDFWASIDDRDAAQALEQGLLADYEGSHHLFVNDSHNATGVESETLARVFFPEAEGRTHPLQGTESLVSIAKARALLGFEPQYSVQRWFEQPNA